MKTIMKFLFTLLLILTINNVFSQSFDFDTKYDITVITTNLKADGELFIKNGSGNTFTGELHIVGELRKVFGWYTEKKSEGGMYRYNTKGIVFYVDMKDEFQYNQLYKGIFSFDETYISGTYFFWGNEFIFYGNKSDIIDNPSDTLQNPDDSVCNNNSQITIIIENNINDLITLNPNPVNNTLTISSSVIELNNLYIELYSENGLLINRFDLSSSITNIDLGNITKGIYFIKVFNKEGQELGTMKIIKC